MQPSTFAELKRRTVVKSLLWRLIGVVWTWIGAYFIILIVPPTWKNAAIIATLIVIYHHSTRMIMYYFYERIWAAIAWGKYDLREDLFRPMCMRDKVIWTSGALVAIAFIFSLIICVAPLLEK